jgi:acetyl-CoA C-acetyltransferase
MRPLAIIGIGQTPVDEHWNYSLRELAGFAALDAINDAGRANVDGIFVGNMLSGALSGQQHLGALLADWLQQHQAEAVKIEAACGSGAASFRAALMAVASGEMDSALAVGVEKMTEAGGSETTSALATAADADFEAGVGLSFVAINALVMQRYMHEYGWKHQDFATFSINAHANGARNPNARLQFKITPEQYAKEKMVASPINLLDASPVGDGAAAALIVPLEMAIGNPKAVRVLGAASASDSIAIHDRFDPLWLSAAALSAQKAYQMAGITPKEISLFELHDAFSIMSALSLEACGFAERGQGPRFAMENDISPTGKLPICTQGGLKARGHPVGATGMYQIVEATAQLRGEGGANQVPDARIAMTQNIGGSGATILTHILGKTA